MPSTILLKKSGVASAVPSTLSYGELALNYADGRLFYKNAAGDIVPLTATSGLNAKLDPLTFNGTTTTFNLTSSGSAITPANANCLLISLNGVIQEPAVSFTVSGSQITFAVAPSPTDTFFGVHLTGGAISGGASSAGGDAVIASPAQITSDQNNYALPANTDIVRLSTDAVRTITGFEADTGAVVTLFNVGSFDIRIDHEDTSSLAANRVISSTGGDIVISPNDNVTLVYDATSSRWRTTGVVKQASGTTGVYEFTRASAPNTATGNAPGPYTWTLPATAKAVEFAVLSGGGGGGSGRKGSTTTARFGGSGGAGAAGIIAVLNASTITTPLTITVGSGGGGGASVTANDTNGNNGSNGGASNVAFNGATWFTPPAGGLGGGGTDTSSTAGAADSVSPATFRGSSGGAASASGTGGSGFAPTGFAGVGGAAGGSINSGNGILGVGSQRTQSGMSAYFLQWPMGSAAVDAGAASITGNATAGPNGITYGAGGNGGGAATNSVGNSGAGGNGGDGYVRITVWS